MHSFSWIRSKLPPIGKNVVICVQRTNDAFYAVAHVTEDGLLEDWDGEDVGYAPEDIYCWRSIDEPVLLRKKYD